MATGEDADDESLGGAEMHARKSGLADYLAADELDAIAIGRRIVSRLNWRKIGPAPHGDAAEPLADVAADRVAGPIKDPRQFNRSD